VEQEQAAATKLQATQRGRSSRKETRRRNKARGLSSRFPTERKITAQLRDVKFKLRR
jgi:hypothetical protein